jgi:hypothetical protein
MGAAAASRRVRLALDHHYPQAIAKELRNRSHDVVTALERDWDAWDDEPLLVACTVDRRTLLTNNVRDFAPLARQWAADGRTHCGLIFSSDSSMPRTKTNVGAFVDALDSFLKDHPGADDFNDRIHWL